MNNLKEMKLGDEVLFYHSQEGNCIMGRMKVIEEAHQDKTTDDIRWVSVTFEPLETLRYPIALKRIKQTKELETIGLVKQPKLSVMKLCKEHFEIILNISNNP